ncbi:MAG: autotransporter assembly complex protein TamA [Rhodospirillum sp.]|nr:autotransporter assembly complex protein TamA [Rhodospirillum sp.]MCF8490859.1 autotransporter assembly complex protein TamA [Rhodospirillum sp.]MCF8502773.1 autotransporter assembly complex protein TamA [Rhodospirillum sp.]
MAGGLLFVLALGLGVPASGRAAGEDNPSARSEREASGGVPYRTTITLDGDQSEVLTELLDGVSQLRSLEATPPFTRLGLTRRVQSDAARFQEALRSRGYYDARVNQSVGEQVSDASGSGGEIPVTLNVTPGIQYTIGVVTIDYLNTVGASGLPQGATATGLVPGVPALSSDILAAEDRLVLTLKKDARPLAKVVDRQAVVDHRTHKMDVTYVVDAGPPASFGDLDVIGLETVKASLIQRMVPWKRGEPYDEDALRTFRSRLSKSRLFATIHLGPGEAVRADGQVPISLEVTEAAHRTVAAGASYATDKGPGVTLRWEHRNLLGAGEKFRADLVGALYEQSLELSFRRPYFPDSRQSLIAGLRAAREDVSAYRGLLGETSLGIEREMGEHWRVSAALAGEYADLIWLGDGEDQSQAHTLLGLPLTAERDDTDTLLDPTKGSRIAFSILPYAGLVDGGGTAFATLEAKASTYYEVVENRLTLAGRARLATLTGADLNVIPPNHRLYAGGGGSVRGYGYQMIGPLDSDGDPTGGRSAAEIGAEARIKVTDTIGLVPFIEGGLVNADPWPSFDEAVRWGAGLGLRYHTDFGPLRADFAVPLNPRSEDDWFQVYFSLGQAF